MVTQVKTNANALKIRRLVPMTEAFGTMPFNARTEDRSARRALDLAPRHRSRRAQGPLPAAAVRPRRLSRRRQRSRPAARATAERLRHRHLRAPLSGQEAVSELLDHRPPLPSRAREIRDEGDRGRHLPAAGRRRRRGRARRRTGADPSAVRGRRRRGSRHKQQASDSPRQHLRHTRGRRLPPRLHD